MGIVLLELWKVISRWRYDDAAFTAELVGTPGAMFFRDGSETCSASDKDNYKSLYNKWHAVIGRATIGCLNSYEYMHVRSSFAVLGRMVEVFPTQPGLGQKLLDALEPLQDERYPLQDIKITAQAYGTKLLKARDARVWKEEDAAAIQAREAKAKAEIEKKNQRRKIQQAELKDDTDKINQEIGGARRGGIINNTQRDYSQGGSSRRPTHENDPRRPDNDRSRPSNDRNNGDRQQNTQTPLGARWERGNKIGNVNGKRDRERSRSPRRDRERSRSPRRERERSPSRRGRSPIGNGRRGGGDDKPPAKRTRTETTANGPNFESGRTAREHHTQPPRGGGYTGSSRNRGVSRR